MTEKEFREAVNKKTTITLPIYNPIDDTWIISNEDGTHTIMNHEEYMEMNKELFGKFKLSKEYGHERKD